MSKTVCYERSDSRPWRLSVPRTVLEPPEAYSMPEYPRFEIHLIIGTSTLLAKTTVAA
jgi:hypothetical protein